MKIEQLDISDQEMENQQNWKKDVRADFKKSIYTSRNKIMTKKRETPEQDLAALLAKTRRVTKSDLEELGSAIRALHDDPAHIADYLKGLFVEDVRRVLEEEGISQNTLAERIGKSRQYLNKILNQDQRINFTIETMVQISTALGRSLTIRMAPPENKQIQYNHPPRRLRAVAEKRPSYRKKT